MGSFATSLHVKTRDVERVAETLSDTLAQGGWRPTPAAPDHKADWPGPSTLRAMQISAARDGWVSILDSDLMGSHALAPAIAEKLATHAIFFFVNDSDSWSYLLSDPKGAASEFDTEEDAVDGEDDFGEGDMVAAGSAWLRFRR